MGQQQVAAQVNVLKNAFAFDWVVNWQRNTHSHSHTHLHTHSHTLAHTLLQVRHKSLTVGVATCLVDLANIYGCNFDAPTWFRQHHFQKPEPLSQLHSLYSLCCCCCLLLFFFSFFCWWWCGFGVRFSICWPPFPFLCVAFRFMCAVSFSVIPALWILLLGQES